MLKLLLYAITAIAWRCMDCGHKWVAVQAPACPKCFGLKVCPDEDD